MDFERWLLLTSFKFPLFGTGAIYYEVFQWTGLEPVFN